MSATILVVDDVDTAREAIADSLRKDGKEVLEAGTLKEARGFLEMGKVDICVLDVLLPDFFNTPAAYARVRVLHPDDDPPDFTIDNGVDARGGFPVVKAGFQRDVHRGPGDVPARVLYSVYFGMLPPEEVMVALPDYPVVLNDNSSYHGIGAGFSEAAAGQPQG